MDIRFILMIFLCSCCLTATATGSDGYYYFGDTKIFLHDVADSNSSVLLPITGSGITSIGLTASDGIAWVSGNYVQYIADKLPDYIDEYGNGLYSSSYFSIKLKSESDFRLLVECAEKYSLSELEQDEFMPLWYTAKVPIDTEDNSVRLANKLYETGLFECVEPFFGMNGEEISYDPFWQNWNKDWKDVPYLHNLYNPKNEDLDIDVSEAWAYSTGRGVKVAVIDSGVDVNHPDLAPNMSAENYDAYLRVPGTPVYSTHATHVAGILGAVKDNNYQSVGVAPEVTIMSVGLPLKPTKDTKYQQDLACAINWAVEHGADIISCSWFCKYDSMVYNAIENAVKNGRGGKGCIVVKSAGNQPPNISFPGFLDGVIAITNMTREGVLYSGSSHGEKSFVTAPGTEIWSLSPSNSAMFESGLKDTGTSMACPHVSGVAALILSRNPNLTREEVVRIIGTTASKVGNYPYDRVKEYGTWNEYFGYGLVNAHRAVLATPLPE